MSDEHRGTALVRPPSPRLAEGIVTHQERQPVDAGLAGRQHADYVAALRAHGWDVVFAAAADDCPDGVFVEDLLVVVDGVGVLTRPGAPARRGELDSARAAAVGLGLRVAELTGPGTLDGGDVLQVGSTIYVGRGGRTDDAGIAEFAALVEPLGRTVQAVPLRAVLHLKSALTALPDGTLIGLPELIDASALPAVSLPPEETGAHVVPLGGNEVLVAASAPATARWLRQEHGCEPVVVDITEFEKLEGCVTCLNVLLPRTS